MSGGAIRKDVGARLPRDVEARAELDAAPADRGAQLVRGLLAVPVPDQLHPEQQAAAAHVRRSARGAGCRSRRMPFMYRPSSRARSSSRSRTRISITLRPTAAGSGSAAWVV